MAISAAKKTRWSLRIITRVGDPAASWQFACKSIPRGFPDLGQDNLAALDPY
jgi:hypothetical protein